MKKLATYFIFLLWIYLLCLLFSSCSKEAPIHTERWQVITITSDTLISHVCLPIHPVYDTVSVVWNIPNPVSYLNGQLTLARVKDGIYVYEYFIKRITL